MRMVSRSVVFFCGLVFIFYSCRPRSQEITSEVTASSNAYTYEQYTQDCFRAVGEIPEFSCLDGEEINLHNILTGPITPENHIGSGQKCDTPTLVRGYYESKLIGANNCVSGTRIGRLPPAKGFEDDVQIVFICRKYYNHNRLRDGSGKVAFSERILFDDANVIAHNTQTGATCFFANNITHDRDEPIDGRQIPRIGSKKGKSFWKNPEQMKMPVIMGGTPPCINCHDNDPFINIPFNYKTKFSKDNRFGWPEGMKVVPEDAFGPFYLVGEKYFQMPEGSLSMKKPWPKLRHLVSREAEPCTSCHRIGAGSSCGYFLRHAAGIKDNGYVTKHFQGARWMPPHPDEDYLYPYRQKIEDVEEYKKAEKFIQECCENPAATKCQWEAMPKG